jgi:hypothetical protein
VLAGFCLDDGVLWVGAGEFATVGDVQRAEEEERGSSSSPPFLMARVGAEGARLDRRDVYERGYKVKMNGSSDPHSNLIFSDFCSPGVRSNARKKFKFEFLKTATVVCQDIGQGI